MTKTLNQISKYLTLSVVFGYPLFFLPIFPSNFDTSKLLFLVAAVVIISLLKITEVLIGGDFKIRTSKFDLLVVGLMVVYLLSGIFVAPNKMDAFFLPGTVSFVIFGSILYFFISQLEKGENKLMDIVITSSAVIFSIVQLLSFTGIVKINFNGFGNLISSLVYLLMTLALSSFEIVKSKKIAFKAFFAISTFVIFISSFTIFYSIMPGKATAPILPSLQTSWSIAIDTLKTNPLLGVGPSNYLASYTKLRPITANGEAVWSSKFLVASNTLLTVVTEAGILGLLFFVLLFVYALNKFKDMDGYKVGILISLIASLFYPFAASLLPFILIFFALNKESKEVTGTFNSKIPLFLISLPFLALVLATSFYAYKAFYPEYMFGKVLKLITANDAAKAYDALNQTLKADPYVDRYHLAAANINIAIAQNLAKKEKLTDEEKTTLSGLIQQAIAESKAAVSLNPTKSSSWENLGDIYVNISPFAKDANTYAIQSYGQAISFDPIDPNLRIKLGGVYYADGKFDEAVKVFELAVLSKPDLANGHYNLAMAYKGNKQIDKAKEQINLVLKMIDPKSKDYELAEKELDSLNNTAQEKPNTETSLPQSESLTPPATPAPAQEPQVQIPQ